MFGRRKEEPPQGGVGLALKIQDGNVFVDALQPKGGAELSGAIKVGDELMCVNGKPIRGKTIQEIAKQLAGPLGIAVELTIKNQETEAGKAIRVERQPLMNAGPPAIKRQSSSSSTASGSSSRTRSDAPKRQHPQTVMPSSQSKDTHPSPAVSADARLLNACLSKLRDKPGAARCSERLRNASMLRSRPGALTRWLKDWLSELGAVRVEEVRAGKMAGGGESESAPMLMVAFGAKQGESLLVHVHYDAPLGWGEEKEGEGGGKGGGGKGEENGGGVSNGGGKKEEEQEGTGKEEEEEGEKEKEDESLDAVESGDGEEEKGAQEQEKGGTQGVSAGEETKKEEEARESGTEADSGLAALVAWLSAIEACRESKLPLPSRVVLLIEGMLLPDGGFHAGSAALAAIPKASLGGKVKYITVSGASDWMSSEIPCLGYGCKGRMPLKVELAMPGGGRPMHSGHYGGLLQEPLMELVSLLHQGMSEEGKILEDVQGKADEEDEELALEAAAMIQDDDGSSLEQKAQRLSDAWFKARLDIASISAAGDEDPGELPRPTSYSHLPFGSSGRFSVRAAPRPSLPAGAPPPIANVATAEVVVSLAKRMEAAEVEEHLQRQLHHLHKEMKGGNALHVAATRATVLRPIYFTRSHRLTNVNLNCAHRALSRAYSVAPKGVVEAECIEAACSLQPLCPSPVLFFTPGPPAKDRKVTPDMQAASTAAVVCYLQALRGGGRA